MKSAHYKLLFDKIGKNTKLLWNVINGIVKKTNNRHEITELLYDGRTMSSESEICEAFNKHFANAGKLVQDSITKHEDGDPYKHVPKIENKMVFKRVTESQICRIVDNLKAKNSCGVDHISNNFLKQIIHVIKLPLCQIFNMSLNAGMFPNLMKLAKVLPLFKSGDPTIADNYRPILLLPVISKVLEKVVYQCIVSHVEDKNIVYDRQFGFRKRHSTVDAIVNFTGEVLQTFDSPDNKVIALFVDLKKAFDTVSHEILLGKLKKMGIDGIELKWLKSYLENRSQIVCIGNTSSSPAPLKVGMAQGSILSVLLFQLFINDVHKCLRYSMSILYADDTTIFLHGKSLRFLRAKLQSNLNSLSTWLETNQLKLNVSKTKCMVLTREGLHLSCPLTVNEEEIEFINEFNFLGMLINNQLDFGKHFNRTYDKLFKSAFVIRYLGKILPKDCLRVLYYTYFHSHLMYGSVVWLPLIKRSCINTLYLLQKRLIRSLSSAPFRAHCNPLFKASNILKIEDQLLLDNLKLIFRSLNELIAKPIMRFFIGNGTKGCRTRNTNVRIVKHSATIINKSFLCKAVRDWNNLDLDTKKITNAAVFAKKVKKDIISKY